MIFIKINNNNEVVSQHLMPFHPVYGFNKTEEELLSEGFLVEAIPEPDPELAKNKLVILLYSQENGFSYRYDELPSTPPDPVERRIEQSETEILNIQLALTEIFESLTDLTTDNSGV